VIVNQALSSDVNNTRTLKAKAKHYQGHSPKAKAMAIPMQRITMKYEVMKSCFSSTLRRLQAQFNNITHHWHGDA